MSQNLVDAERAADAYQNWVRNRNLDPLEPAIRMSLTDTLRAATEAHQVELRVRLEDMIRQLENTGVRVNRR